MYLVENLIFYTRTYLFLTGLPIQLFIYNIIKDHRDISLFGLTDIDYMK